MTKQELEEKIKNNEFVYVIYKKESYILKLDNDFIITKQKLLDRVLGYKYLLNEIFSTEEQAQHYLNNANVTRTEKLPYVTWEEFNNGEIIAFITKYGQQVRMCKWEGIDMVKKPTNNIMLFVDKDVKTDIKNFDYTEENFYKAYEVCRKLFKGEKV